MTASDDSSRDSEPRPVVSVVLPVYNGAGTITDTIASVLQQTLTDFELIIIDDGSTDETLDMVARFSDGRIQIFSFENKGLPVSRNRGIRRSRSDLVAFIDADDLWVADKLERQVERLRENPEAALVYSWSDMINENDRLLNYGSHVCVEGDIFENLLVGNFLDSGSNPIVRKRTFERVGMFDETFTAAEDWEMWLRITYEFRIVCVPEVHIYYRVHGAAMSSSIKRQELESMRVLKAALDRVEPSEKRASLQQAGERNLYRYFTARVAQTATGPGRFSLAMGYLREFWVRTPSRLRDSPQALVLLIKIVIVSILPTGSSRILLGAIGLLRGRYRKVAVFAGRPK